MQSALQIILYNENISSNIESLRPNGAQGFITGKKLYIGLSSGGIFTEGPFKPYDFAEPYLRFIFSFIGITDITIYRAQGLSVPGIGETALQKAIESIVI